MLHDPPNRLHVRLAALTMTGLLALASYVTVLGYRGAFDAKDEITVSAPRAGLVLDSDAKVKFLGVQVGTVRDIWLARDHAEITLAVERAVLRTIPSNATVRIGGTTIFGAKAVELLEPKDPASTTMRPGQHLQAQSVQLEVNTLFQNLVDLIHKVDPVKVGAVMTALGDGLRGNGDNLGALLAGVNQLADNVNTKMPVLASDIELAGGAGAYYANAAPDLGATIDHAVQPARTIADQRDNLDRTLLATIALSNSGSATVTPAADDLIAAVQRFRLPLKVVADYSPEIGCILKTLPDAYVKFGPVLGGRKPGLFATANFLLGSPTYTYPESLPVVNASGGPNCRGLPNLPTKQYGGSWYRAPFLVTDNANVPYQPMTELQVDAPSTLQFLFNGAYAERDAF